MKLLDILVRELPKCGGWPVGVSRIEQSSEGRLFDYNELGKPYLFGEMIFDLADDWNDDLGATRYQYEAALATSKTDWDGRFPIPAGTEVEVHFDGDDSRVWTPFRVEYMSGEVIVLHDYRIDSVDAYKQRTLSFRPTSSEVDKKREKGVVALATADPNVVPFKYGEKMSNGELIGSAWYDLYDAIAAGKVPGIRID